MRLQQVLGPNEMMGKGGESCQMSCRHQEVVQMKFAWDMASEQEQEEHMTTLASGNAGAHTMVMKATFQ